MARANCFSLFVDLARLAASRTFWTAGSSRPIRIAMMAITTNSSISVNARRNFMADSRGDSGREPDYYLTVDPFYGTMLAVEKRTMFQKKSIVAARTISGAGRLA